MRIGVVGAGPAGLLCAYLVKCRRPDVDVRVVEQNARDATFGFGVVFSHGALEFLARDVPVVPVDRSEEQRPVVRERDRTRAHLIAPPLRSGVAPLRASRPA